jgi:hypothetical protein
MLLFIMTHYSSNMHLQELCLPSCYFAVYLVGKAPVLISAVYCYHECAFTVSNLLGVFFSLFFKSLYSKQCHTDEELSVVMRGVLSSGI